MAYIVGSFHRPPLAIKPPLLSNSLGSYGTPGNLKHPSRIQYSQRLRKKSVPQGLGRSLRIGSGRERISASSPVVASSSSSSSSAANGGSNKPLSTSSFTSYDSDEMENGAMKSMGQRASAENILIVF